MACGFWYRVAHVMKVRPKRLMWVQRDEVGEKFGRKHHHFLLRIEGTTASIGVCHVLAACWKQMGGGSSDIRLYDPRLSGADYMLKGLSEKNEYEVGKFSGNLCQLTFSHRTQGKLRSMTARSPFRDRPYITAVS